MTVKGLLGLGVVVLANLKNALKANRKNGRPWGSACQSRSGPESWQCTVAMTKVWRQASCQSRGASLWGWFHSRKTSLALSRQCWETGARHALKSPKGTTSKLRVVIHCLNSVQKALASSLPLCGGTCTPMTSKDRIGSQIATPRMRLDWWKILKKSFVFDSASYFLLIQSSRPPWPLTDATWSIWKIGKRSKWRDVRELVNCQPRVRQNFMTLEMIWRPICRCNVELTNCFGKKVSCFVTRYSWMRWYTWRSKVYSRIIVCFEADRRWFLRGSWRSPRAISTK